MTADTQKVFIALADTTRRDIINTLTEQGAHTATQLSSNMAITRQGVAKHINILIDAGLVSTKKQGREVYYDITPQPLQKATEWIADIEAQWDKRLIKLQEFIENEADEDKS